jgi:uncharacterized protein YqgV (UPF0045/DUF77 family)
LDYTTFKGGFVLICKYDKLIKIINKVKEIIDSLNTDVTWSGYNTIEEVIKDLDSCIEQLKQKDKSVIEKLKILFAPTGAFQEISIDSGWSDKYLELASSFDKVLM